MNTKRFWSHAASVSSVLACLVAAALSTACHSGAGVAPQATAVAPSLPPSNPPPQAPAAVPTPLSGWQGHLGGAADGLDLDGLLTADGSMRFELPIGEEFLSGGRHFVGHIDVNGTAAHGSGMVIEEGCIDAPESFWCSEKMISAEISVATASGRDPQSADFAANAEITLSTGETWVAVIGNWGGVPHGAYYSNPADLGHVEGTYMERRAEFEHNGDTTVTVDAEGRMFFQSLNSGCIGNGTLAPHADGGADVYDVALTIESCNLRYAGLNGSFKGLATHGAPNPWDAYNVWLMTWLSTADTASPQVALTMWEEPVGGPATNNWDY